METIFTVLILLLAVALSGVIVRLLPVKLPLPLLQIAIGALLTFPRINPHVTFDPDIFMALFIPPLLFADGWRIPKREFFMQRRAILMLAGRSLNGSHPPATTIASDYFESANVSAVNGTTLVYENRSGSPTSINDRVVVISP